MRHTSCLAAFTLLTLTACGGGTVKETLGINRKAPDEFRVVARPPLSVPPQFNLRPPVAPGEASPGPTAEGKARALITGVNEDGKTLEPSTADTAVTPVTSSPLSTSAEGQFLKNAGAERANTNVRRELEADRSTASYAQEEEESSWWSIPGTNKKDAMVDAKKESERLKKNKEEGKPVTEGATPETKGRDTGVLGRILGY